MIQSMRDEPRNDAQQQQAAGLIVLAKFKFKAKHDDKHRQVVATFVSRINWWILSHIRLQLKKQTQKTEIKSWENNKIEIRF